MKRIFTLIELLVVIAMIAITTSSSISVKLQRDSLRRRISLLPERPALSPLNHDRQGAGAGYGTVDWQWRSL